MFTNAKNLSKLSSASLLLFAVVSSACDEKKDTPAAPTAAASQTAAPSATALASASAAPTATAAATADSAPQAAIGAGTFDIELSHSRMGFGVKHMMVSTVRGEFKKFSGLATIDTANLAKSSVTLDIDVDSVDTHDAKRDTHLKSKDFFETSKFPKMTFKSTSIEKSGAGYKVTGDLTIRDVTKPVTLDLEPFAAESKDPMGGFRTGTHATGKINRSDFGLKYNSPLATGGVAIGDEVKFDIDVELVRKSGTSAAAAAPTASAAGTATAAPSGTTTAKGILGAKPPGATK